MPFVVFLDIEAIVHRRCCVVDMRSPRIVVQRSVSLSGTDATKNLAIMCTSLKLQKGGKHEIYVYCWMKKRVNRNE